MLPFFHTLDHAIEQSLKNLILNRALLYVLFNMPTKRKMKASERAVTVLEADTNVFPPTDAGQIEAYDGPPKQEPLIPQPSGLEEPIDFPIPPVPPPSSTNQNIKDVIQLLTHLVAAQSQRQTETSTSAGPSEGSACSRVRDFHYMGPPEFTESNLDEDPQNFIDEIHRTLKVMHVSETEAIELASY